MLYRSIVDITT
ncbi:hypothetical protein, partial [Plasmodium yoelii yoelii]